jgi:hypothetical protein
LPFVRISRDKRGYEYFYLVHTTPVRRGKTRQRILYWFRTPPNIRVGRTPFDEPAMRAIEAQNPDVTFDWEALRSTPMPPPSAEHWRDRRRAEKVMRQSRAADEEAEPPTAAEEEEQPVPDEVPVDTVDPVPEVVQSIPDAAVSRDIPPQPDTAANPPVAKAPLFDPRRRRRRRRGRRGRPGGQPTVPGATEPGPTDAAFSSSTGNEPEELSREEPGDDEGE